MITTAEFPSALTVPPKVTVYGPETCPLCEQTIKLLDRRGITATRIKITPGDSTHTMLTQELGFTQAPVVTVTSTEFAPISWSGHRADLLLHLARLIRALPDSTAATPAGMSS